MRCADVNEKLSAYLDGELDGNEYAKVTDHIETCEDCRLELSRLREICILANDNNNVEPPSDLRQRIYAALEKDISRNQTTIGVIRQIFAKRAIRWSTGFAAVFSVFAALTALNPISQHTSLPAVKTKELSAQSIRQNSESSCNAICTDIKNQTDDKIKPPAVRVRRYASAQAKHNDYKSGRTNKIQKQNQPAAVAAGKDKPDIMLAGMSEKIEAEDIVETVADAAVVENVDGVTPEPDDREAGKPIKIKLVRVAALPEIDEADSEERIREIKEKAAMKTSSSSHGIRIVSKEF